MTAKKTTKRTLDLTDGRKNLIPRGEEKYCAKLTEKKVREARKLNASGYSVGWLAAYYEVSAPTMRRALRGDAWRHV